MAIKITKKQEYVDDVAGWVTYTVSVSDNTFSVIGVGRYDEMALNQDELLELKEALNNLDIK